MYAKTVEIIKIKKAENKFLVGKWSGWVNK
jgi:hypothetical protein